MGTAIVLILLALAMGYLTRFAVWFTWNMEIVNTRRGKTIIKLIGLILVLMFLCPGLTIFLIQLFNGPGLIQFPN